MLLHPPGPWHGEDRNPEETVRIIGQPSQTHIPRLKSRQQRKEPAGFDHGMVGLGRAVAVDVPDAQQQKGEIDGDEDSAEDKGGFQRAQDQHEGEDEPALVVVSFHSVGNEFQLGIRETGRLGNPGRNTIRNSPRES